MLGFEQLSELTALREDRALLRLELQLVFTDQNGILTDLPGGLALAGRNELRLNALLGGLQLSH